MPEKVHGERCPKTQRKEAPAAEEMDKCCGGRLQPSFFPPSLLLFYYAFRLYGFTCVCVCFQSETPISNRLPHCSLLGWLWIAFDLPQHLAFSLLGLYTRASEWSMYQSGGEA